MPRLLDPPANSNVVLVAADLLSSSVTCLILLLYLAIPCTSGAMFSSELPSSLRKSDLSKKSCVDPHSSLSYWITGTSSIDPTPS